MRLRIPRAKSSSLGPRVAAMVAVSALCGAASSFSTPAARGVVVEVVPAEMRYAANALLKIGQNTVKIAGPAVGGVLVAAVGSSWVIGWGRRPPWPGASGSPCAARVRYGATTRR